jgi:hypothetical protein
MTLREQELRRIIGWCRRRLSHPSLEKYVDQMLADASRIEARSGETGTGSISNADESLTRNAGDAHA